MEASDDVKAFEMDAEMKKAINELLLAAARLCDTVQKGYRAEDPVSHHAICTLVEQAGDPLMVSVRLTPLRGVEAGILHAGKWEPFLHWSETVPDASKTN